jgi:hypothetical protein
MERSQWSARHVDAPVAARKRRSMSSEREQCSVTQRDFWTALQDSCPVPIDGSKWQNNFHSETSFQRL